MKKFTFFAFAALALSVMSCKKDRVCECTHTHTAANGDVTSEPQNTSYKKVRLHDAKSVCQKETQTYVASNGDTSTDVYDCKLK